MTTKFDFLRPADSDSFLGRRKEISDFSNLLRGFRQGKGSNGTIIVGKPGIGKTSLLQMFKRTAESDRLETTDFELNFQQKVRTTVSELYHEIIEPRLSIEKRKKYEKKRVDIPAISAESEPKKTVEAFLKNLELAELSSPIIIFIDNVDRAEISGYGKIIVALVDLISSFTQLNIPIFLVLSMLESTWETLKPQIGHVNHFILDFIDFSTAELILRKKTANSLRDPEFRKQILGEIDRTPFGLTLVSDIIRWYEEKYEEEEPTLKEIQESIIPLLRERKFGEIVEKMFSLSNSEKKVIQAILNQPINFITLSNLQSVCESTSNEITRLEGIKLLTIVEDVISLSSQGLYERMQGQAEIVASIESDLMLRLIEGDLRAGFKPVDSMLDQLETVASRKTETGESARNLGVKGKAVYRFAFDNHHLYDACRLAILSGQFLDASGDSEGAGLFLEECGKEFTDANRPHYAKMLYREALKSYSSDWRIKTCAREAARIYLELAEDAISKDWTSFARSFLYEAVILYKIAEESSRMQTAINKARETYGTDEKGTDFFDKLMENNKSSNEIN